jgi:hypothetical protein
VKEALGIADFKLNKYKEMAEFLGSKRFTERALKDYFKNVFPITTIKKPVTELVLIEGTGPKKDPKEPRDMSRNAELALTIKDSQPGANFAEGSWWQAFNTVTFMIDHKLGRSDDSRNNSAWFGQGNRVKINALQQAVEFAKAA